MRSCNKYRMNDRTLWKLAEILHRSKMGLGWAARLGCRRKWPNNLCSLLLFRTSSIRVINNLALQLAILIELLLTQTKDLCRLIFLQNSKHKTQGMIFRKKIFRSLRLYRFTLDWTILQWCKMDTIHNLMAVIISKRDQIHIFLQLILGLTELQ